MKLISYIGTRPGIQGVGSWLVRVGTHSPFSHTEVLYEPGDGVAHLMPDGSLEPNENGEYWCSSASAGDIMPEWSYRAGKRGGVRFKRIKVDPSKWLVQELPPSFFNPVVVAQWFVDHQGAAYDYRNFASFAGVVANWIFSDDAGHYTCTECCARSMQFAQAHRFNPGNFPPVIDRILRVHARGDYVPMS